MVKNGLTTLAVAARTCQGDAMRDNRTPMAGGLALAVGAVAGTIWGVAERQPSAGMLIGLSIGAAVALVIWLRDRRT